MKDINGKINKRKIVKIVSYLITLVILILTVFLFNLILPNIYTVPKDKVAGYVGVWIVLIVLIFGFILFGILYLYNYYKQKNKRDEENGRK